MVQILGLKNETISVPRYIEFTADVVNGELSPIILMFIPFSNSSVIIGGDKLLFALQHISIARS